MNGIRFLKPKFKDLIVRDPISKNPLSNDGEVKPWSGREGNFWRRRVADGSAIICEQKIILPKEDKKKKIKKGGK